MQQMPQQRTCHHCYFSRLLGGILHRQDGLRHCVKNPPALDRRTGLARWPVVKDNDICGCFRYGDENPLDKDRWPKNDLPIYTDRFGDYCKIPLTKNRFAKVDPEDYIWLSQFRWFCQVGSGRCYAARNTPAKSRVRQKQMMMHRVLAGTPEELVCDHINGDGLDNRKKNLRNCTQQENNMNARSREHTSRFKGVYWKKMVGKWNAVIHFKGRRRNLGYFKDEVAAAKAYDEKAKEIFGRFAYLNFATKTPRHEEKLDAGFADCAENYSHKEAQKARRKIRR
jgi:hypothetical protein